MKPSEKDWDENTIDLLLFEYLEGQLSVEQAKKLQEKLVSDVCLQAELAHWQDAFFNADFLPTEALEKNLLKEEAKTLGSTSIGFIWGFLLLTSVFSFFPLSTKKGGPMSSKLHTNPTSEIFHQQAIINNSQNQTLPIKTTSQVVPKQEIKRNFEEGRKNSLRNIKIEDLPTVAILSPQINPSNIAILKAGLGKTQTKKSVTVRKISGKERRKIERMKEKGLQRRIANKFVKGRVPYVVPLDTKNF